VCSCSSVQSFKRNTCSVHFRPFSAKQSVYFYCLKNTVHERHKVSVTDYLARGFQIAQTPRVKFGQLCQMFIV
jgi:hypothetical protein